MHTPTLLTLATRASRPSLGDRPSNKRILQRQGSSGVKRCYQHKSSPLPVPLCPRRPRIQGFCYQDLDVAGPRRTILDTSSRSIRRPSVIRLLWKKFCPFENTFRLFTPPRPSTSIHSICLAAMSIGKKTTSLAQRGSLFQQCRMGTPRPECKLGHSSQNHAISLEWVQATEQTARFQEDVTALQRKI